MTTNETRLLTALAPIMCGFIFVGCGDGESVRARNDSGPDAATLVDMDPIPVTAVVKQFEDNEHEAKRLYAGRTLRIFGDAVRVIGTADGKQELTFKTSLDTYAPAKCIFTTNDEIGQIDIPEGSTVAVVGKVVGFQTSRYSVLIEECQLR